MPKNIVVCCDGTGNEFGDTNSNVVKLHSVLENSPAQATYYHPGLGTMGSRLALTRLARWWTKVLGLAFGYGLMDNLSDAYIFLMNEFEPGDQVFLFGFSRGAYTVRALAAFLHMFGLIRRGNDGLVPYAIRRFKGKVKGQQTFDIAKRFKQTFTIECKTHFIGVWDTVSSVGWIYDPLKLPYTAHNPDIAIGRHAISIDERRCAFRQNLWQFDPNQDSKQVWFAGVHCDVGGGYAEAESGLSKITLAWMLREAKTAGLAVDAKKESDVLGGDARYAKPDPCAGMHNSLALAWLPLEVFPRRYTDTRVSPPQVRWRIPLGARRYIQVPATLHQSVVERTQRMPYSPSNLPQKYTVEP